MSHTGLALRPGIIFGQPNWPSSKGLHGLPFILNHSAKSVGSIPDQHNNSDLFTKCLATFSIRGSDFCIRHDVIDIRFRFVIVLTCKNAKATLAVNGLSP